MDFTLLCIRKYNIFYYNGFVDVQILHNSSGCDPGCWYFSAKLNELVVAGREVSNCLSPKSHRDIWNFL